MKGLLFLGLAGAGLYLYDRNRRTKMQAAGQDSYAPGPEPEPPYVIEGTHLGRPYKLVRDEASGTFAVYLTIAPGFSPILLVEGVNAGRGYDAIELYVDAFDNQTVPPDWLPIPPGVIPSEVKSRYATATISKQDDGKYRVSTNYFPPQTQTSSPLPSARVLADIPAQEIGHRAWVEANRYGVMPDSAQLIDMVTVDGERRGAIWFYPQGLGSDGLGGGAMMPGPVYSYRHFGPGGSGESFHSGMTREEAHARLLCKLDENSRWNEFAGECQPKY